MRFNGAARRAVIALGAVTLVSSAASAPQGGAKLSALARLEPGLWQLRILDSGGARLAFRSPRLPLRAGDGIRTRDPRFTEAPGEFGCVRRGSRIHGFLRPFTVRRALTQRC